MRIRFDAISRVVICSVAPACSASTDVSRDLGPVTDGSLTTDATGYLARQIPGSARPTQYEFTVVTRFENRTGAPVYLARCLPTSPQPMYSVGTADGYDVRSAYAPNWACVGHNKQFEILPGVVRVDTFLVRGPNAFDEIKQQPIGATDGAFRLGLFVATAPGDGAPAAPGALGISNAFTVRTAQ